MHRCHRADRKLTLFQQDRPIKAYTVALGRNPTGPKVSSGDGRTPKGTYSVDGRNPKSAFHLSLHLSYPNSADTARASAMGVPPGGDIMIHGIKNGLGWLGSLHRFVDWTRGCVAVTNDEIEEIGDMVPDGIRVEIVP